MTKKLTDGWALYDHPNKDYQAISECIPALLILSISSLVGIALIIIF